MPEHSIRLRRASAWGFACVLGVSLALALPPSSAIGSQGSVPAEVASYASDPAGLRADLDDLFGIGSGGSGVDFNDSTEIGAPSRVFGFTEDFLAGVVNDAPVERRNEWTASVSVNDAVIGLATIWINPSSVQPELADFERGNTVAAALATVGDEAYLVRDDRFGAWFSLEAGILMPLIGGSSGISGSTPLTVYQTLVVNRDTVPSDPVRSGSGTVVSVVVIALAIVGVAIILIAPQLIARRRGLDATDVPPE